MDAIFQSFSLKLSMTLDLLCYQTRQCHA